MTSASDSMPLPSGEDWPALEDAVMRFDEAWRQVGPRPVIEDYLPTGGLRSRLLVELVHVELELRLKAGEAVRVEEYLSRYPELSADAVAAVKLIAAELDFRRRSEPDLSRVEYLQRFPQYHDELARLFQATVIAGETLPPDGAFPPVPDSQTPPNVPGYEVLALLGHGGMGVVYKARDMHLGRHVAIKVLPPQYARNPVRFERFMREARTLSALNHPHICTVHALFEHAGYPCIVMEFVEGKTLHAVAARRPGMAEIGRLVGQAAKALMAAHAAGVVHRDIKPENIMARDDGYVKVLDFGLARRLPTTDSPAEADTDPGVLLGTAAYMSPEQTRGQAAESASDIFSLGIVLYLLLTGRHPFDAESRLGILHAIGTAPVVPPSRLNPELPIAMDGLMAAMLHKEAALRPTAAEVATVLASLSNPASSRAGPAAAPRLLVHREAELAALRAALDAADAGRGSLVCVAGEPGIGKTTLVEDFLDAVETDRNDILIARGQCSERLASTEAYLPVIDGLGDLLRGKSGASAARLMMVVAPTWFAQARQFALIHQEVSRAPSQPAMLREFTALLQEMSRLGPVVLFFDDVHWADASTVDLLAYVGRHCSALRVLVIATYRPTELLLGSHPFNRVKLELQAKGLCTELSLGMLSRSDVDHYLWLVFPNHAFPADFASLIHARTEGSPLFMAHLLRYMRERGVLADSKGRWTLAKPLPDVGQDLPESVRGMIQRKLDMLDEAERRLLSAASVQGAEFASAITAGALVLDAAEVEEKLQVLHRVHGLVRPIREVVFPDGTLSLLYGFVHVLYQQALYGDLPPTRRAVLGATLARELESRMGATVAEAAAQLACLYEVGRDFTRAARHLYTAAQNAARVFAHQEAVELSRRGLRVLLALPESPERIKLEMPLQTMLGLQLQVTKGYAAPEATQAYGRARELGQETPGAGPLFPVLWGLWLACKVRSELSRAQHLAGELQTLAQELSDPDLALQAQQALTVTALCRGEPAVALEYMEQGVALYDPARHAEHSHTFGQDPGVACKAFGAVALWLLGYPDQSARVCEEAVLRSHALWQSSSQALSLHFAAMLHQLRRDGLRTRAFADACAAFASEHGLSFWLAGSTIMFGWALAAEGSGEEAAARLRRGLDDWQATGSVTYRTYFLGLLAEVLGTRQRHAEARQVVAEALALVEQTGERVYEAELHRLDGVLLLAEAGHEKEAEHSFKKALAVAGGQNAKSLELRAAMSLARLCRKQGQPAEGRKVLARAYDFFTEGFDTRDLQEAKALLEQLK